MPIYSLKAVVFTATSTSCSRSRRFHTQEDDCAPKMTHRIEASHSIANPLFAGGTPSTVSLPPFTKLKTLRYFHGVVHKLLNLSNAWIAPLAVIKLCCCGSKGGWAYVVFVVLYIVRSEICLINSWYVKYKTRLVPGRLGQT